MEHELLGRSGLGVEGSERPPAFKAIGISLAIGSGVFIGSSFVLKKVGLLKANEKYNEVAGEGYGYLKNFYWWSGMTLMIIGEICNLVAYSFTDAILVTPMGALSVVICAILSAIFLKERLSMVGKVACFLCIVGSVVIALNAPHESSVDNIQQMQHYVITPGFLTFTGLIIVGSIATAVFVAPRWGKKNMLVYISICSWIGGLSVVCTQGLGAAIIAWIRGNPQYKEWFFWVLLVFVVITLLTEIVYLNKALNLFNAALVTPTYYVYFTSTTIITSVILFQGFKGTTQQIITVVLGFLTICSGVVLLQLSKSAKDVPDTAVFAGDLDQIQTIAEQEQPESEPKADAIRGAAAIVRNISQIRQKKEVEELKRLHEEKMLMDQMEPISENGQPLYEWDGLRRRRTMTIRTSSTRSRSRAATSPPPSSYYAPRHATPRPQSPGQHPPLGMSQFPADDADKEDNDGSTIFSSIVGTIRGRGRTNASAPPFDEFMQDKNRLRGRSPMHPVPLTEISVPGNHARDDVTNSYYSQTIERDFAQPDPEYRGSTSHSNRSLAPTPPPHSARRQFSFQNVFRRAPQSEEPTEEERVGLVKDAEGDSRRSSRRESQYDKDSQYDTCQESQYDEDSRYDKDSRHEREGRLERESPYDTESPFGTQARKDKEKEKDGGPAFL